jgi:hypothetical protein
MSKTIEIILLFIAFVCFLVAAFFAGYGPAEPGPFYRRINLIALGLAAWVLVPLGTLVLG